jgi:hypothetical protein
MGASLLYILATYAPHVDVFYFLTEPYANLATVLEALLLLRDRRMLDAAAGGSLAVGVLFNQTVFLFGLAYILFRALMIRTPANRTREYLLKPTTRFTIIGAGFAVPMMLTGAYFHHTETASGAGLTTQSTCL